VPIFVADSNGDSRSHRSRPASGCLALVERPLAAYAATVLASAETVVILEGVSNADNVGGVFRNAAAFGASVLLSPACCDPLYRKAIRTSMGAVLRVPFARLDEWPTGLAVVRESGFTMAALTPREPAEPLGRFARGHTRPAGMARRHGGRRPERCRRSRGRPSRANPDQPCRRLAQRCGRRRDRAARVWAIPHLA
jgi:hypothetical protein